MPTMIATAFTRSAWHETARAGGWHHALLGSNNAAIDDWPGIARPGAHRRSAGFPHHGVPDFGAQDAQARQGHVAQVRDRSADLLRRYVRAAGLRVQGQPADTHRLLVDPGGQTESAERHRAR